MKFASFERIVEAIYTNLPGNKNDYGKPAQTAVAFTGGYLAGILCAIISHPADVMVSKLNANRQQGEAFGSALSRIYGDIGFAGLWNGLVVRIVMVGTLTGLQWMMYVFAFLVGSLLTDTAMTRSRSSWVFRPRAVLRRLRRRKRNNLMQLWDEMHYVYYDVKYVTHYLRQSPNNRFFSLSANPTTAGLLPSLCASSGSTCAFPSPPRYPRIRQVNRACSSRHKRWVASRHGSNRERTPV